jgi:hypothetical protein
MLAQVVVAEEKTPYHIKQPQVLPVGVSVNTGTPDSASSRSTSSTIKDLHPNSEALIAKQLEVWQERMQIRHEEKQFEHENIWTSCGCMKMDKRCIQFLSKFSISMLAMGFCLVQLSKPSLPNETQSAYMSLLTFILGVWLPSPSIDSK